MTGSAITEIPVCRCGIVMLETRYGSEGYYCLNCDRLQDIERAVISVDDDVKTYGDRLPTIADDMFNKAFKKSVKEWYPDQPKSVSGNSLPRGKDA